MNLSALGSKIGLKPPLAGGSVTNSSKWLDFRLSALKVPLCEVEARDLVLSIS